MSNTVARHRRGTSPSSAPNKPLSVDKTPTIPFTPEESAELRRRLAASEPVQPQQPMLQNFNTFRAQDKEANDMPSDERGRGGRWLAASAAVFTLIAGGAFASIYESAHSNHTPNVSSAPTPYDYPSSDPTLTFPVASPSSSLSTSPSAVKTSASPSAIPTHIYSPSAAPSTETTKPKPSPTSASPTAVETSSAPANAYCTYGNGVLNCTGVYSYQFASTNSPRGPLIENATANCSDVVNGLDNITMASGTYWYAPVGGVNPCA